MDVLVFDTFAYWNLTLTLHRMGAYTFIPVSYAAPRDQFSNSRSLSLFH